MPALYCVASVFSFSICAAMIPSFSWGLSWRKCPWGRCLADLRRGGVCSVWVLPSMSSVSISTASVCVADAGSAGVVVVGGVGVVCLGGVVSGLLMVSVGLLLLRWVVCLCACVVELFVGVVLIKRLSVPSRTSVPVKIPSTTSPIDPSISLHLCRCSRVMCSVIALAISTAFSSLMSPLFACIHSWSWCLMPGSQLFSVSSFSSLALLFLRVVFCLLVVVVLVGCCACLSPLSCD
jgi:hypothetical protein